MKRLQNNNQTMFENQSRRVSWGLLGPLGGSWGLLEESGAILALRGPYLPKVFQKASL